MGATAIVFKLGTLQLFILFNF